MHQFVFTNSKNRQLTGYGIGFRSPHFRELSTSRPSDSLNDSLDFLEIISENYIDVGGRPREYLDLVRDKWPIVMHGVSFSPGSPDPIRKNWLQGLKKLVDEVKPALVSDHLCFTSLGGHNSHDLLPVPYTLWMLKRISDRVKEVQDTLGRQLLLENPSAYVGFANSPMPESEFFTRLVEATGCGILLDLNNLIVNHINLGLDPVKYLVNIPKDAVKQFHLAGHSIEGVVRIDTHDHPVCSDVWALYSEAKKIWPKVPTLLERDDHIPPLSELLEELNLARTIDESSATNKKTIAQFNFEASSHKNQIDRSLTVEGDTQVAAMFSIATGLEGLSSESTYLAYLDDQLPVPRLTGAHVYHHAYFARIRETLAKEMSTIKAVTTDDGFSAITEAYIQTIPPASFSMNDICQKLPAFLRSHDANLLLASIDFGVPLAMLADMAAFDVSFGEVFVAEAKRPLLPISTLAEINPEDWDHLSFEFDGVFKVIDLEYAIDHLATAIHEHPNELNPPDAEPVALLFTRRQNIVDYHRLDRPERDILAHAMNGQKLRDLISLYEDILRKNAGTLIGDKSANINEAAQQQLGWWTMTWIQKGLITGLRRPD